MNQFRNWLLAVGLVAIQAPAQTLSDVLDADGDWLDHIDADQIRITLDASPHISACHELESWAWRPEHWETSPDIEDRIVYRVLHAVCIDTDRAEDQGRRIPVWLGFRLHWATMGRGWSYAICVGPELEDLSNSFIHRCPTVDYQRDIAAWKHSLKPREVQAVELPPRRM